VLNGSRAAFPSARAKKRRLATTSRNGVLQSHRRVTKTNVNRHLTRAQRHLRLVRADD
jgi:hypothetical protein